MFWFIYGSFFVDALSRFGGVWLCILRWLSFLWSVWYVLNHLLVLVVIMSLRFFLQNNNVYRLMKSRWCMSLYSGSWQWWINLQSWCLLLIMRVLKFLREGWSSSFWIRPLRPWFEYDLGQFLPHFLILFLEDLYVLLILLTHDSHLFFVFLAHLFHLSLQGLEHTHLLDLSHSLTLTCQSASLIPFVVL